MLNAPLLFCTYLLFQQTAALQIRTLFTNNTSQPPINELIRFGIWVRSAITVIETAKKTLYTGHIGDGKIFVYGVDRVVKVRTGEENSAALQDGE